MRTVVSSRQLDPFGHVIGMDPLNVFSITQQVAMHLRSEILTGSLGETMPGRNYLAEKLGVSLKAVQGALEILEDEGLLTNRGHGRKRLINLPASPRKGNSLRIGIFDYDPAGQTDANTIELHYLLAKKGHTPFFTSKSLTELDMNVQRIARLTTKTEVDAWIICSGSRPVLEWFSKQKTPVFAKFGRRRGLPIAAAGPDHVAAWRTAAHYLLSMGHKRIAVIVHEGRRVGGTGSPEQAVFDEMQKAGIPTSHYNFPAWEDTCDGFHSLVDELFRVTPPTALIIDEPYLFHAAKEHLAQRGILAPRDVSLICADPDATFDWCRPSVAHVHWDHTPVTRRVMQWAHNVARGRKDITQTLTKAEFIQGQSVGPAPS